MEEGLRCLNAPRFLKSVPPMSPLSLPPWLLRLMVRFLPHYLCGHHWLFPPQSLASEMLLVSSLRLQRCNKALYTTVTVNCNTNGWILIDDVNQPTCSLHFCVGMHPRCSQLSAVDLCSPCMCVLCWSLCVQVC